MIKINRLGIPDHKPHNKAYNELAGPLAGEILQTDSLGPVGYLAARSYQPASSSSLAADLTSAVVDAEVVPSEHEQNRFDLSDLGDYERVVFSCLAWGQYRTYVLVGEMGSGKTASANFVLNAIRRPRRILCSKCTSCQPVVLSLDFNRGFNHGDTNRLMRAFRKTLREKLDAHLGQIFRSGHYVDDFLRFIAKDENIDSFAPFVEFGRECEDDAGWARATNAKKVRSLFSYIKEASEDDSDRIELLLLIVDFLKGTVRPDPSCLILLLDNIDSVAPPAQFEILVEILSHQDFANVKTLVPLRRSTFENLKNHAAYSFGIINHVGPSIASIIQARLEYYNTRWEGLSLASRLPARSASALRNRVKYLGEQFIVNARSADRLRWLAGSSIRLGLFMFERAFINNAVEYDRDPHYTDEVLRAIFVGENDNQEMIITDRFVANLFCLPPENTFSLIQLRILQFLFAFADHPIVRTSRNLWVILKAVNKRWTSGDVVSAVNYLLRFKRPLVWVDGKAEYESVRHFSECCDTLFLTEAGEAYLRHLARDLSYFQEAVLTLRWPAGASLPAGVQYWNISERFDALRRCLRVMMDQDLLETQRFNGWYRLRSDYPPIETTLITNHLLFSLGQAVVNILRGSKGYVKDVLRDWQSLVLVGAERERRFSGSPNSRLEKLAKQIESEVGPRTPRGEGIKRRRAVSDG